MKVLLLFPPDWLPSEPYLRPAFAGLHLASCRTRGDPKRHQRGNVRHVFQRSLLAGRGKAHRF